MINIQSWNTNINLVKSELKEAIIKLKWEKDLLPFIEELVKLNTRFILWNDRVQPVGEEWIVTFDTLHPTFLELVRFCSVVLPRAILSELEIAYQVKLSCLITNHKGLVFEEIKKHQLSLRDKSPFDEDERILPFPFANKPGVYCILSGCGKMYVGQSKNVHSRLMSHMFEGCERFNGITNIFIAEFNSSKYVSLNHMESYYIAKLNTFYNGLNKTRGNKW